MTLSPDLSWLKKGHFWKLAITEMLHVWSCSHTYTLNLSSVTIMLCSHLCGKVLGMCVPKTWPHDLTQDRTSKLWGTPFQSKILKAKMWKLALTGTVLTLSDPLGEVLTLTNQRHVQFTCAIFCSCGQVLGTPLGELLRGSFTYLYY